MSCLSRHTGEVPPKGAEGEGHRRGVADCRSDPEYRLDQNCQWGFPPPTLRATSPV